MSFEPEFRVRRLSEQISLARDHQPWARRLDQARHYLDGPPVPPEQGVDWLARELVERVWDNYDAVALVTGEEGGAKTTLAYLLTQACNRLTGNPWDPTNLCYQPEDVVSNYEALFRGEKPRASVITFDEGSEGLLAGETFEPAQVVLVRMLFRIRTVGGILLICVPDIWAIAKKLRGRRVRFWVDIERRGTDRRPGPSVGAVFERDARRHFKPTDALGLADSLRCPRLSFARPDPKDPSWVGWEERKRTDLGKFFDEARAILARRRMRLAGRPAG